MNHRARDESHLSWVVPLGCLRDVVHEVELARRCFGHLPARGKLAKHLVLGPADVVALLPLVVELQRLVCLEKSTIRLRWDIFCVVLIQYVNPCFVRSKNDQITCWCVRNYIWSIMQKYWQKCKNTQGTCESAIVLVWTCHYLRQSSGWEKSFTPHETVHFFWHTRVFVFLAGFEKVILSPVVDATQEAKSRLLSANQGLLFLI